ncbi:unnamed protein product [Larinioides sclopetarius]|uniref:Uncharacterized protein n=1 Tax=Larinioides sclopetarius TaxID=280406 RepID=A0AAV1ZUN7_9ARAC
MTLHVPSFITLPTEGMSFKWVLDKRLSTLPSNMRPSKSGASLRISELRKEQEGVVACSVFTNLGVQATHVDFSIKQVESDNNKLVFVATRPPHHLIPHPNKGAILSKLEKKIITSGKRELSILSDVINHLDRRSLNQVLLKIPHFKQFFNINNNIDRKRKKRSLHLSVKPDNVKDLLDSEEEVTNLKTDNYLRKKPKASFKPRYMSRRHRGESFMPQEQAYDNRTVIKRDVPDPDKEDYLKDGSESENRQVRSQNKSNAVEEVAAETTNRDISKRRKKRSPQLEDSDADFQNSRIKPSLAAGCIRKRQIYEDLRPPMNFGEEQDSFQYHPAESNGELNPTPQIEKHYFGDSDRDEYDQESMETREPSPTRRLSVFERRRQAFLEKLQERDCKRQQMENLSKQRLRATIEPFERLFDVEEGLPPIEERDKLAMLLGKCEKDTECSMNAMCVKKRPERPGFCRCLPKFEGNGIFCWEGDKWII